MSKPVTYSTRELKSMSARKLSAIAADKRVRPGVRKQARLMQWGLEDGEDYWEQR